MTGSSGAAASTVGAKTIHSTIAYGRRYRRRDEDFDPSFVSRKEASRFMQEKFSAVKVLVVDEISMVAKTQYLYIETGVTSLRGNS